MHVATSTCVSAHYKQIAFLIIAQMYASLCIIAMAIYEIFLCGPTETDRFIKQEEIGFNDKEIYR